MISVLNHLLPLNGNKQVTFVLIPIFIFLFSCRTTKTVVEPEIVEPIVIVDEIEPEIKDSIVVPIIDIVEDTLEIEDPIIKNNYQIALLLPFSLDKYNYSTLDVQNLDFNRATQMSVEFYQGFNLAIEEINNGKLNAQIHVFDTKNNPEEVKRILKKEPFPKVDIVVGPIFNKNLRVASNYCRSNEIPMISPLSSSTSITTNNKFYYSANGTSESHYEALLDYIHKNFPDDTLRIIHNNTQAELKVIRKLEEINSNFYQDSIKFNNLYLPTETSDIEKFKEDFDSLRNHIVLIPSTNEIFTSFALSKLSQIHNYFPSVVFGMPTWKNFKNINYDYLEWLQVHLTSSYWVNEFQYEVTNFKRDFTFKYSMPPSEYAYQGYDLANFIASYLVKDINYKKEKDRFFSIDPNHSGLQTKFEFVPRASNNDEITDYWDNQYIQMLKFENYRFNKVD